MEEEEKEKKKVEDSVKDGHVRYYDEVRRMPVMMVLTMMLTMMVMTMKIAITMMMHGWPQDFHT